jgi:hypothetical protein
MLASVLSAQSNSKKYRWPLNINNGYSSTFLEFRSNHFHAGIDLRTFQKTGFPIYAISDGYVCQIRQVKRGSGKGVYLRHSDGFLSKYFHLDRFSPEISRIADRICKKKGLKYFGNYFLKRKLYIKKGDLIGYTGETGAGFPHLHLEIRDPNNKAVNPFNQMEIPGSDFNKPVFKSIIIRSDGKRVLNGRIGELFFSFNKINKNIFKTKKSLFFSDSFELVLNALDIADTGMRVTPYVLSAMIDDQPFFELKCDSFEWKDNNQLGFVYDMEYSSPGSPFFNLFTQPGYQLENTGMNLSRMLQNLSFGEHLLKITLRDFFGNTASGLVPLIRYKNPLLKLADIKIKGNQVDFEIKTLQDDFSEKIRIKLLDASGVEQYVASLTKKQDNTGRYISLQGISDCEIHTMIWEFLYKNRVFFKESFILNEDEKELTDRDLNYRVFVNKDKIFLKLIEFKGDLNNIDLSISQSEQMQEVKPLHGALEPYFMFKPLNDQDKILLKFRRFKFGALQREIKHKLDLIHLIPDQKKSFTRGNFFAGFGKRTVRESKVLIFKTCDFNSEYSQISDQIDLSPYNFPFLDKVVYSFRIPEGISKREQLGIFRYDKKRRNWRYKYSSYDEKDNSYNVRLLHSGVFALMRDDFPPVISLLRLRTTTLRYLRSLILKIIDKGKGVDDSYLRIVINGEEIDAEYDPDWLTVYIKKPEALKKGMNIIKVAIRDFGSNLSERIFKIYLK